MAESSTGAGNRHVLAGDELCLLESFVHGDACAEDGCGLVERQRVRDDGEVVGVRHGVLLERAVHAEARALGVRAVGLGAGAAEGAVEARGGDPLDAHTVADLDELVGTLAERHDHTGTLVATDERQLVVERPVAEHGVQIRVADARVDDADERLAALELLLHGHVLDRDGAALLVEDGDAVLARHVELLLARVLRSVGAGRGSSGSHFECCSETCWSWWGPRVRAS